MRLTRILTSLTLLFLAAATNSLGNFEIPWHTIDGGGGTSAGGNFALSGTIGQHDAGNPMTGGNYSLIGGFWAGTGTSSAPCPADLTGDQQVNIDDIFAVLGLWGTCPDPCPPYCTGDLTEDCVINIDDIFSILGQWGPCD